MLMGKRIRGFCSAETSRVIDLWIDAQAFAYNSKVAEYKFFTSLVKLNGNNDWAQVPVDNKYAHFLYDEEGQKLNWLRGIPGDILGGGTNKWYEAMSRFFKKLNGKPRFKQKDQKTSVYLKDSRVFRFSFNGNKLSFEIGTISKPQGVIRLAGEYNPATFTFPKSLTISKKNNKLFVSFCYEDNLEVTSEQDKIDYFHSLDESQLNEMTLGVDLGVVIPVCTNLNAYTLSEKEADKARKKEKYIKKQQRKLARQTKGSNQYKETKCNIAKGHSYLANCRSDRNHKITHQLANLDDINVFVLEDLNVKKMTKKAEPKKNNGNATWNNKKKKSRLNKAILDNNWSQFKTFLIYKANRKNKLVVIINPKNTSRECSCCGYISKQNRKSQSVFECANCGNKENADINASKVIKKRGIEKILVGYSAKKVTAIKKNKSRTD